MIEAGMTDADMAEAETEPMSVSERGWLELTFGRGSKSPSSTGTSAKQSKGKKSAERVQSASFARQVRLKTGLSQAAFAARIGVGIDTVRSWERGKRTPAGPARALLRALDRAPNDVLAALA